MSDVVQRFVVGDQVVKLKGYPFPGDVRAAFTTNAGKWRYVVEHKYIAGLLHIFNGEQLERGDG